MGRRVGMTFLILLAAVAIAFLLGPRVGVDTTIRFDPSAIGDDPQAYVQREEAAVPGIRDGLEKEIIWADPMIHDKTPFSVVYVHGFSASKGEIRPLPDEVADQLDANLFYTRLTGHGQDGAAMTQGSVNAWINDYEEAIAIGRAIGRKVIVIATSSGGSLAAWAASRPDASEGVAAIAFISPNFGLKASGSEILTMPWGAQIAELVAGKERGFEPANPLQEKYWTYRYPMAATPSVAALAELAYGARVENAKIPALFIFSDSDKVVRADRTREVAQRWGAAHEIVPVDDSGDPQGHVIAGDAMSPATTKVLAERIVVWVEALANQ